MIDWSLVFQTTRTDFSLPTYEVKRRYSDFLWLRQALTERYPLRIIPVNNISDFSPHMMITGFCLSYFVSTTIASFN